MSLARLPVDPAPPDWAACPLGAAGLRCAVCSAPSAELGEELHQSLEWTDRSLHSLAARHGVPIADVRRHLACSVWPAGAASPPGALAARVGRLEAQARAWHDEALAQLNAARTRHDTQAQAQAIDRGAKVVATIRGVLELAGKLSGELDERARTEVTVNALVASAEWVRLRAALEQALEPYPEARAAVVAALVAGAAVTAAERLSA